MSQFVSLSRRAFLASTFALLFLPRLGFPAWRRRSARKFRFAFGSCLDQSLPHAVWGPIAATQPDLFLFLGDNVYADAEEPSVIRQAYATLAADPGFHSFRQRVPILATWDDHDYGWNDGGREYLLKEESREIFCDFFGEPADSVRRRRQGIYQSYYLGDAGCRIQFLVLDLRWNRTRLNGQVGEYEPDPAASAELLGEEQWAWLEKELDQPADVRFICSSIQFFPSEHGWEKWANFPRDKARLLRSLNERQICNAIVLSGDMHYGELSLPNANEGGPLLELTSSGLNYAEPAVGIENSQRAALFDEAPNFGLVDVEWNEEGPRVTLGLHRAEDGSVVFRKSVALKS